MPAVNFTFQESSPLISYSPGWIAIYDHGDPFKSSYNGIFRPSSTKGATATISFLGTGISIFGAIRDNHGNYSVSLDGGPPFVGSGFSDPFRFNFSLWNALDLPFARHTAVLTNIPLAPNLNFVDIDYISIERQVGGSKDPIFQLELDDTSPSVKYTGDWETSLQATAFNATLHGTVQAGSQVSIKFPGCCIEVYGQYANANYTAVLDDQTPTTLRGFDADLVVADQQPKTLLYLADNLDEVNHTLVLTNLDTNKNRPFYFDYAVVRSTHNISSSSSAQVSTATSSSAQESATAPPSAQVSATASSEITQSSTPSTSALNTAAPTAGTSAATIIGGVIGGLLALSLVLFLLYLLRRQQLRAASKETTTAPVPYVVPRPKSAKARHTARPLMSSVSSPDYSQAATASSGVMSLPSPTTPVDTSSSGHGLVSSSGRGTASGGARVGPSLEREVDSGITLQDGAGRPPPIYGA